MVMRLRRVPRVRNVLVVGKGPEEIVVSLLGEVIRLFAQPEAHALGVHVLHVVDHHVLFEEGVAENHAVSRGFHAVLVLNL